MTNCDCRPHAGKVRIAVVTLSDTRTLADDRSGNEVIAAVEAQDHEVAYRELIADEREPLESILRKVRDDAEVQAVITTGGTGLAARDQTVDVVRDWIDAELPGFGEHFRRLSIEEIGPAGMLSRALAGRMGRTVIFCLPGSTGAVRTAMQQCVLPILPHAVGLVSGKQ